MMESRVEQKWVEAFRRVLEMCALRPGDVVAILSETQSRAVNVQLVELAALGLGARAFHLVLPTPRQPAAVGATRPSQARSRTGRAGSASAFRNRARCQGRSSSIAAT